MFLDPDVWPLTCALLEAWDEAIEIVPVFMGRSSFGMLIEVPAVSA